MSREVLFEMTRIGNSVKVTALDSQTMIEVSIVGPATASPAHLRATALKKLEFVMARRGASAPGR